MLRTVSIGKSLLRSEPPHRDSAVQPATPTPSKGVVGRIDTAILNDHVGLITINSEARLNAFSEAMRGQLIEALRSYDESRDTFAIVITGAGRYSFSAGQDLSEAEVMDGPAAERWVEQWCEVYTAFLNLKTPTVAALNGYAVGAGLQTALMCDVRVTSTLAHPGCRRSTTRSRVSPVLGHSRVLSQTLESRIWCTPGGCSTRDDRLGSGHLPRRA